MTALRRLLLVLLVLGLAILVGVGGVFLVREEKPGPAPPAEPAAERDNPLLPHGEPIVIGPPRDEPAPRGTLDPGDPGDPGGPAIDADGRTGAASLPPRGACPLPPDTDAGAGFVLRFGDEVSPYRLMSAFVLPRATLEIAAELTSATAAGSLTPAPAGDSGFSAKVNGGTLRPAGPGAWRWSAPADPGIYCLRVADPAAGTATALNLFVLEPYRGEEIFQGYRLGAYQRVPLRGRAAYALPAGFVRVTPELIDVPVSPHFRLGQFLAKQTAGWPKFLLLRTRLLLKLEMLLDQVNDHGIAAETFTVMSGYRTPAYNADIGNTTTYSRHLYGDAADIFVDDDGDGVMDDLDGDGRVGRGDAERLAAVVEGLADDPWYAPFVGGLSVYDATPAHGPFVHVDTRGTPSRW